MPAFCCPSWRTIQKNLRAEIAVPAVPVALNSILRREKVVSEAKSVESQVSADTRNAQSKTTSGHFIPFSVREAQYRRQGYGSDSRRMAQFQSSSMGQQMGMGGTASDPLGSNQDSRYLPDPLPSVSATPTQPSESRAAPGGFLQSIRRGVTNALGSFLPDPQSPQGHFLRWRMSGQPLEQNEIADANAYAKSMGTTFDPTNGYSRQPFTSGLPLPDVAGAPKSSRARTYSDPAAEVGAQTTSANSKLLSDSIPELPKKKDLSMSRVVKNLPDLNF